MEMKDIEKQIAEEQTKFNNSVVSHKLPVTIILDFKKAFMAVSPMNHRLAMGTISAITSKKTKELTNLEARQIINVILSVAPSSIWENFEIALERLNALHELTIQFNLDNRQLEQELTEQKTNLMNLTGNGISKPKLYTA